MAQKKYIITITTNGKITGRNSRVILVCEVKEATSFKLDTIGTQEMTDHDLDARMFALEFAANNHSELPMRVHISVVND